MNCFERGRHGQMQFYEVFVTMILFHVVALIALLQFQWSHSLLTMLFHLFAFVDWCVFMFPCSFPSACCWLVIVCNCIAPIVCDLVLVSDTLVGIFCVHSGSHHSFTGAYGFHLWLLGNTIFKTFATLCFVVCAILKKCALMVFSFCLVFQISDFKHAIVTQRFSEFGFCSALVAFLTSVLYSFTI